MGQTGCFRRRQKQQRQHCSQGDLYTTAPRHVPGTSVWQLTLWVVVTAVITGEKSFVDGCHIHGVDIGYCEPSLYEDSEFR